MMARRTVSLSDGMENAVRKLQTVLMLEQKRDVTFAEALHNALFRGFVFGGGSKGATAWWKGEPGRELTNADYAELLEGNEGTRLNGVLDMLSATDVPSNASTSASFS